MKKLTLSIALFLFVYIGSSFTNLRSGSARVGPNLAAPSQVKVQPFCKFTIIDHRGHSIKLSTHVMHASHSSITFIFETGEKLIMKFSLIRAGHFFAESARSKEPQITYFPAHSSNFYPMVGAVVIASTKPLSGNFNHLMSDDDDVHLNLVSGTFSF